MENYQSYKGGHILKKIICLLFISILLAVCIQMPVFAASNPIGITVDGKLVDIPDVKGGLSPETCGSHWRDSKNKCSLAVGYQVQSIIVLMFNICPCRAFGLI